MVLVLAGEKRDRLGVLGQPRTASALPYGGKFRVIDFTLSNCVHSGLSRVGILTQYAPLSLNAHIGIGRAWDLDRREAGVQLLQPYVRQRETNWYRGSADALAQNRNVIAEAQARDILVLSGELVGHVDYMSLLERHQERRSAATVVTLPGAELDPEGVAWAAVDDRGRVRSIAGHGGPGLVPAASIYVFQGRVLREWLDRPDLGPDLVDHVLGPMIADGIEVHADPFDDYLRPIRTIEAYYESNMDLLKPVPLLKLHDADRPVLTPTENRAPTFLGAESDVTGSLLAHGCRIEGTVRDSILFAGVQVAEGAIVESSIVMHDARIQPGAHVRRSILDKRVRIGEGARIGAATVRQGGAGEASPDAIAIVGKASEIPARADLQAGSEVGVEVRESDFPALVVSAGKRIDPKERRAQWPG